MKYYLTFSGQIFEHFDHSALTSIALCPSFAIESAAQIFAMLYTATHIAERMSPHITMCKEY